MRVKRERERERERERWTDHHKSAQVRWWCRTRLCPPPACTSAGSWLEWRSRQKREYIDSYRRSYDSPNHHLRMYIHIYIHMSSIVIIRSVISYLYIHILFFIIHTCKIRERERERERWWGRGRTWIIKAFINISTYMYIYIPKHISHHSHIILKYIQHTYTHRERERERKKKRERKREVLLTYTQVWWDRYHLRPRYMTPYRHPHNLFITHTHVYIRVVLLG